MTRHIHTVNRPYSELDPNKFSAKVSLRPTPGVMISSDRSETAPRTPMIRVDAPPVDIADTDASCDDMTRLTPHMEALAYRLHFYASREGWDTTHDDLSKMMGASKSIVKHIITSKRWGGRIGRSDSVVEILERAGAANGSRARKSYGRSFDENTLDLVDIMR